jgi:hypothetical protein
MGASAFQQAAANVPSDEGCWFDMVLAESF